MDRLVRILWRWTLLMLFLVALAAASEDLLLRYRIKRSGPASVFEQTSIYDAAENKGGRVEIYFDHPETRECVHAIFPHFGDAPCWYVKRHTVKLLSKLWLECAPFAPTVARGDSPAVLTQ